MYVKKIIICAMLVTLCASATQKEKGQAYLFPLEEPTLVENKILCSSWYSKLRTENGVTYKYRALNYPARYGSQILSPGDGVVTNTEIAGYEGGNITISFENGDSVTLCHLSKFLVLDGAMVSAGQPIGLVGTSGRTTGSHVRIRWQKNGERIFCNAKTWGMEYDDFKYSAKEFDCEKAEMYR